eukprot:CAMPEP_0194279254 /NCGR_PEP_ID=MMETSP0169-20130528/13817_1 /TAXON_ID=218684 /ORGANISM="Corethron pennatum, Strain L29A3" /LENGTH=579 /DNA_ID=CAMNT_0039023651 /DNA_START=106 /DNA_END=1845 /DNA_ORIENTATION=+
MTKTADEYKAEGNKSLTSGDIPAAISAYTKAIELDPTNRVYYSNRSAAYLKKGDAQSALEDAEATIGVARDWPKGYSRKAAALHALKKYGDSILAYEDGLALFPNDATLTKGLAEVKKESKRPPPPPPGGAMGDAGMGLGNLFGPDLIPRMALNPKFRGYLSDPEFMKKLQMVQANPNSISSMLGDPRIMEVMQFALGMPPMGEDDNGDAPSPPAFTPPAAPSSPKEMNPTPMETDEDTSGQTAEEIEERKNKAAALKCKARGNELYKAKKFDEALAAYDEAIALDPCNMTFIANKASVFLTSGRFAECKTACDEANAVGKENRAPFEERAKVLARAAKALEKTNDYGEAIVYYKNAQLEHFDKAVQRRLKNLELEKRKMDALNYQDEDKAEEAKQKGNDAFRGKDWPTAIKNYEDAVKRSPKNAAIRNNLSAALCKIMDFNGAKREVDKAIELDPKYTKAFARRGEIEMLMKENHKALESFKTGLGIDPSNAACKEGLRKCNASIMEASQNMTEEERKERAAHGMADPEIQGILSDPVIRQVLQDFNDNPREAQQALSDPAVAAKINKLIAAGVVQTG